MVSCEYASIVGGQCGQSVGNPANTQSIPIRDCGTDIRNYLRAAGFANSTLKTDVEQVSNYCDAKLLTSNRNYGTFITLII